MGEFRIIVIEKDGSLRIGDWFKQKDYQVVKLDFIFFIVNEECDTNWYFEFR